MRDWRLARKGHDLGRLLTTVAVALTTACATTTTEPGPDDEPTTGSLTVIVSGLPGGVAASVTVSGPGGFSRTVSATETLWELMPGTYTVAAAGPQGRRAALADGGVAPRAARFGIGRLMRRKVHRPRCRTTGSRRVVTTGPRRATFEAPRPAARGTLTPPTCRHHSRPAHPDPSGRAPTT